MRYLPPGHNSQARMVLVKPCGPIQRVKCSGSAQHLKTRSRGASKMRSIMSIGRGESAAATSSFPTTILLSLRLRGELFLQFEFAQIFIEPIEPLVPEMAI